MKDIKSEQNFDQFYIETSKQLYKYAYNVLHDKLAAEDAVQDAFCAAFKYGGLQGHPNPAGWLMITTKRAVVKQLKKRAKEFAAFDTDDFEPFIHDPGFDKAEFDLTLQSILSGTDYQIAKALFIDGVTEPELAKALHLTPNALYFRVYRIKMKIKQAYVTLILLLYTLTLGD